MRQAKAALAELLLALRILTSGHIDNLEKAWWLFSAMAHLRSHHNFL